MMTPGCRAFAVALVPASASTTPEGQDVRQLQRPARMGLAAALT